MDVARRGSGGAGLVSEKTSFKNSRLGGSLKAHQDKAINVLLMLFKGFVHLYSRTEQAPPGTKREEQLTAFQTSWHSYMSGPHSFWEKPGCCHRHRPEPPPLPLKVVSLSMAGFPMEATGLPVSSKM